MSTTNDAAEALLDRYTQAVATLRNDTIPALRKELLAALAAAPAQQAGPSDAERATARADALAQHGLTESDMAGAPLPHPAIEAVSEADIKAAREHIADVHNAEQMRSALGQLRKAVVIELAARGIVPAFYGATQAQALPLTVDEYQAKYARIYRLNDDERYGYECCRTEFVEGGHPTRSQATLPVEFDVRKIMLSVVPGVDGMGHEIYAKSVADVEKVLGEQGEKLENWELGILRYKPNRLRAPANDARLGEAPAPWRDPASAPKDGTIVRLLVQFTEHPTHDVNGPCETIGANTFDLNGDEPSWFIAGWSWSQDCFTSGEGTVIGWLPFFGDFPEAARNEVLEEAIEAFRAFGYPSEHILDVVRKLKTKVDEERVAKAAGQAISDFMTGSDNGAWLDWHDSRNVDALLAAIKAAR